MINSSLKDFEDALKVLDKKLGKAGINNISIRAIGGFAMMYYEFRKNGYTIDIDSLTKSFDEKVVTIIKEVGNEQGIDEDWLNTDCAELEGFLDELSSQICWVESKYKFENIDLKIADVIGLVRSKAKAINDGGLVPRSTDKKDLLLILQSMCVTDINILNSTDKLKFIRECYPRCYDYLDTIYKW